ncbi:SDR family oxidoreductase [Leptolyngbya sp. 15MV]|nr:SDR family oxidoreductase [Leptolyngbya sp. 15MV]
MAERPLLIRGARVLTPRADPHRPPPADVLIRGGRIAAIATRDDAPLVVPPGAEVIPAEGMLLIPGLISAHYHSYDTLLKGRYEDVPFDVWALHSQPAYWGRRSRQELRVRTLLGALEALRAGITTIQDMNSLVPQDEETLDTILAAYAESGIRCVFSIALRDLPDLDIAPFLPRDLSPDVAAIVGGAPRDAAEDLRFVAAQLKRLSPLPPRLHWALSASGPQRSSRTLLEGLAALSAEYGLPVFTHVYETRAQLAKARRIYPDGSMITRMEEVGLLTPRTTLAHAVHITEDEIARVARAGAGVVHNPLANLKLKNGVAPLTAFKRAGVRLALGCDNNSCSDCQNLFQAMKMYAEAVTAAGGRGIAVACDHADAEAVTSLVQRIEAEAGRIDLLVNNAWGGHESFDGRFDAPFWEHPLSHWDAMMDRGVRLHLIAARAVVPGMVTPGSGLIVATTFWDQGRFLRGNLYYDLAKAAISRLALGIAEDVRSHGVASLALSPGWMRTEWVLAGHRTDEAHWQDVPALARTESPRYLGRAVAALAGDADVMRHSGKVLRVADLAEECGFTDIDGRRVPAFELPPA